MFGQISKKDSITSIENAKQNKIQNPLTRKGAVFIFWGWNRAAYGNSDIHFKGNGYDFVLHNVKASDKPASFSYQHYFAPDKITIPQTNLRIAYFIKDNIALVAAVDHMKYVMNQNQTVNFSGYINDPKYSSMVQNGQVDLTNEEFLTFEHTDGLNYVNFGLEKYKSILNNKKFDIIWAYGAGLGVLVPKSNIKLFGNERSDRFHFAGFGLDARTNINFVFFNHIMARIEAKFGYINMPDIKTTLNNKPDKAIQDFVFGQINFGIGYIFQTKKVK